MYSFVSTKSGDKWIAVAVRWHDIEAYYDSGDYCPDLKIKTNKFKTELIKNYKGFLGDDDTIEFDTKEDADIAIKDYIEPLLAAATLVGKDKKNGR